MWAGSGVGVDAVLGDGVGHDRALDLADVGQRSEQADDHVRGVDLEVAAQGSRVSLRPMPSVPSGRNVGPSGSKRATCSGTAFMKSVTATIGPWPSAEQPGDHAGCAAVVGVEAVPALHGQRLVAAARLYDVADHRSTPTS